MAGYTLVRGALYLCHWERSGSFLSPGYKHGSCPTKGSAPWVECNHGGIGRSSQPLLPVERHAQQTVVRSVLGEVREEVKQEPCHVLKSSEHQKENSEIYRSRGR